MLGRLLRATPRRVPVSKSFLTGGLVAGTALYALQDQSSEAVDRVSTLFATQPQLLAKQASPAAKPESISPPKLPTVKEAVMKQLEENEFFVFCKNDCLDCVYAKATLNTLVPGRFTMVDLDNLDEFPPMSHLSGRAVQNFISFKYKHKTVPAIFVGQELLGGNDTLQDLVASGEFQRRINK